MRRIVDGTNALKFMGDDTLLEMQTRSGTLESKWYLKFDVECMAICAWKDRFRSI